MYEEDLAKITFNRWYAIKPNETNRYLIVYSAVCCNQVIPEYLTFPPNMMDILDFYSH